ncbi:MAG: hypothetical protein HKP06_11260 [Flavobacteriaceae bacterium]|nr:hypothetical protein [Flavobacteriaceae bacterium]
MKAADKKQVLRLLELNKKRLLHEIRQSRELMNLISKSTTQDLTDEEWKQMKDQLLDVFKSIPALAIFLLPGGALLLPLAVKFIPQIMPSSFSKTDFDKESN